MRKASEVIHLRTHDYDAVLAEMRAKDRAIERAAIASLRARGITNPERHELVSEMRCEWLRQEHMRRTA